MRYTTTHGTSASASRRRGTSAKTTQQPDILPGQRYSMLPAQPPRGISPLVFKGYLASVTVTSDSINISRKLFARLTGNRSVMIPWLHVVAVDFLEPTRLINGHIHFATVADPRGLTATGRGNRMAAAARNPHAIMFTWQQRRTYEQIRDLFRANPAGASPSAGIPSPGGRSRADPPQSVADELAKLHLLYQQGALNIHEYEQAKARLLSGGN